jgi:hypothetical protein
MPDELPEYFSHELVFLISMVEKCVYLAFSFAELKYHVYQHDLFGVTKF